MQKEYLHEVIDRNYPTYGHNFNFEVKIFHELKTQIYEINACLVCWLNRASITLTNNLMERLLKHALIYNEIWIWPIPANRREEKFTEAHKKYSHLNMNDTIQMCLSKKKNIITKKESEYLHNIRETLRNWFSHADSSKILYDLNPVFPATRINLKTWEKTQISLNPKVDLTVQELAIVKWVNDSAAKYFKDSIEILQYIEARLLKKNASN